MSKYCGEYACICPIENLSYNRTVEQVKALRKEIRHLKKVISKFADVPLESVDQLVDNERYSW